MRATEDAVAMEANAPLTISNALLEKPAELRQRFNTDGYLFFKQILPRTALSEVHRDFADILTAKGVAVEGDGPDAPLNAVSKPFREGEAAYFSVHDDLYRCESFHRLAHHPALLTTVRAALGETAFPHPLAVARLIFPANKPVTTPPHQDFPNNQGSKNLTAAWIPLTNCPTELGPLRILRGSHRFGVLPLQFHLGAGNRAAKLDIEKNKLEWHCSEFEQGDVLLFGALTVHSATHNTHAEAMRLSVDFRYQLEAEPITPLCLQPHFQRLSWEDVYENWKINDTQYYWRHKQFRLVPWRRALQEISKADEDLGMKMALKYAVQRGELTLDLSEGPPDA